ncbi:MAG: uncharacterized protein JWO36_7512 [Myxococcales bacterium]|nr:uncharacterized protein [Myxococcales bacterium]
MPRLEELDELAAHTAVTLVKPHGIDSDVRRGHLQVVVIGNGTFATHPLPEGAAIVIGRSNRCDIPVDDESISRRHATLSVGETVTIEDLGSVNGTHVRGEKLKPKQPISIAVGELVGIGTVHLIVQQRSRPMRPRRLWTHEYFEARLDEECARVERSGAAFALLRIHPDRRAPPSFVEETLVEVARESDILGKYGPHEYEVLLPDTPPAKADEAMRRIEAKLLEHGLKSRIFVACCPRDGRSPYQLNSKVEAPQAKAKDKVVTTGTDIVVSDVQMQSLHRMVEQIADSQIGVLLLGETGVGKEVFARAVHRASPRSSGPFVELNCAALTETLLESELFGHEKGAFTNATSAKPGLIETADGGTLLLDEIGDMPLATQVKLLRVIEDSQLRRVGGLKARSINVRFVAATNSDLEAQMAAGAFRRDLYFRLNGVTIVIPPLRERMAEIEPLAKSFISRSRPPRDDKPSPTISPEALEIMKGYSWPGNVRELKNMIERAVLLCGDGPIRPEHLPADKMLAVRLTASSPRMFSWIGTRAPSSGDSSASPGAAPRGEEAIPAPPRRKGSADEQQWIMQALDRARGNQTLAARLLGISRRTLVNRLNEYNQVERPRKDKTKKK